MWAYLHDFFFPHWLVSQIFPSYCLEQTKFLFPPRSQRKYLIPESSTWHVVRLWRFWGRFLALNPAGPGNQRSGDRGGELPPGLVPNMTHDSVSSPGIPFLHPQRVLWQYCNHLIPETAQSNQSTQLKGALRQCLPANPKGTNFNIICRFITSRNEYFLLQKEV